MSWSFLKRQTHFWTVLTDLLYCPTSLLACQWFKYPEIKEKKKEWIYFVFWIIKVLTLKKLSLFPSSPTTQLTQYHDH